MKVKNIILGQKVSEAKVTLAKQFRSEMTPAEAILWKRLRGSQLAGMHFRRQQIIAGFIADFCCHEVALVVELDGDTHESIADAERDAVFTGKGIRTLRFSNAEVYRDLPDVLKRI